MTGPDSSATPNSADKRRRLGLPLLAILGLALLTFPRVVLHDLGIIQEGTPVNAALVFVPPLVWIVVALVARVPRPLLTLVVVGFCSGVLLALGHQALWHVAFADGAPRLGGNLADLGPGAQELTLRGAAAVSSLVTGVVIGAVAGLVAWGSRGVMSLLDVGAHRRGATTSRR